MVRQQMTFRMDEDVRASLLNEKNKSDVINEAVRKHYESKNQSSVIGNAGEPIAEAILDAFTRVRNGSGTFDDLLDCVIRITKNRQAGK